jgi:hypothetical protein
MSKKVRLSTTDFQAFQYALKQSGAEAADLQSAIKFMAKAREEALGGDAGKMAAFSDLGINEATLEAGNFAEMLKIISDTISTIDFGASEGPLLEKILGRGAMEMIPVLQSGLRQLADEAERVGAIMGPEVVGKLDAAGDKVDQLTARFKAGFAPAIGVVVDGVKAIWDTLDIMFGGLGAFAGGFIGTKGNPMEKLKGATDAAAAHHADILARRTKESQQSVTAAEVARTPKATTHVEDPKEAATREANARAIRNWPVGPVNPSDIYNKTKPEDRFGFATARDLEKLTSGEMVQLQKDIARSSARMQQILEQINQRSQKNTKSGPFGSQ